jgi:hypothetical protein
MKDGNWIAIHKLVKFWLPRNRPYTELEALISHTLDIDDKNTYSINGYAKLWGWSRNKVRNFLKNIRTTKGHLKDTRKDSQRTAKGQGIVLKINNLQEIEDNQGTTKGQPEGQPKDNQEDTTINPNTKPNKKTPSREGYSEEFLLFWQAYPKKVGKKDAGRAWKKAKIGNGDMSVILTAIEAQKKTKQWQDLQYVPAPATWINGARWEDKVEEVKKLTDWEQPL